MENKSVLVFEPTADKTHELESLYVVKAEAGKKTGLFAVLCRHSREEIRKKEFSSCYIIPTRSAPFIKKGFTALWSWARSLWNGGRLIQAAAFLQDNIISRSRQKSLVWSRSGVCFPPERRSLQHFPSNCDSIRSHSCWYLPPVSAGASWFLLLLRVQRSALWGAAGTPFVDVFLLTHLLSWHLGQHVSRAAAWGWK